jgi:hypothetical protein
MIRLEQASGIAQAFFLLGDENLAASRRVLVGAGVFGF